MAGALRTLSVGAGTNVHPVREAQGKSCMSPAQGPGSVILLSTVKTLVLPRPGPADPGSLPNAQSPQLICLPAPFPLVQSISSSLSTPLLFLGGGVTGLQVLASPDLTPLIPRQSESRKADTLFSSCMLGISWV